MQVGCADHRVSLLLLAVRRRLAEEELEPEERQRLEDEAGRLEILLNMD